MTLQERVDNYARVFPDRPPMYAFENWIEGTWVGGNNYVGSGYYGAFPPDFVERVKALFPDKIQGRVLHLFSGSLTTDCPIRGVRIDINPTLSPDVCGDARKLPFADGTFDFILADTPYSVADAEKYGTSMPDRKLVTKEAARVVKPGGFMVWLDQVWPMYRKDLWNWHGSIMIVRSTNHRYRGAAIFERN